jgi:hypothetical protein
MLVFNHNFGYWVKQLHGCQTGALPLTEEHTFNTFENKMPGRIYGRKGNRKKRTDRQTYRGRESNTRTEIITL